MRFLLVAIFMLFTNSVFAQVPQPAVPVAPAQPDALPKETPAAEGKLVLTPEQLKAHEANIKKCVSNYQPISNKVRLLVRIGPDGMIEASEALSPIDSEEFRQDVQSATKATHQCEPFNIEPLYKTIGKRFSQEVVFMPKQFDNETRRALNQYLRCVKEYETGPMVRVEIELNADGTFAERPHLLNQTDTPEYLKAALKVMEDLSNCGTANLPPEKYAQWKTFAWAFFSAEAMAEARAKLSQKISDQKQ